MFNILAKLILEQDERSKTICGSKYQHVSISVILNRPWLDLEVVIWNEVRQTKKDKYLITLLTCDFFKKGTNELNYKTELQMWKTNLQFPGGKGGVNWRAGD